MLLCGTQPGPRDGSSCAAVTAAHRQCWTGAAMVVRKEAALSLAVGVGHCRAPRRGEEARQGQADREEVRTDHLGVCHAASPDAFPQGPR